MRRGRRAALKDLPPGAGKPALLLQHNWHPFPRQRLYLAMGEKEQENGKEKREREKRVERNRQNKRETGEGKSHSKAQRLFSLASFENYKVKLLVN